MTDTCAMQTRSRNRTTGRRRLASSLTAALTITAGLALAVSGAVPAQAADADTLTGWGFSSYGQVNPPAGSLDGKTITAVSAGGSYSLVLTSDGRITAFGANTYGQTSVPSSLATKTVTSISAGYLHALALTSDGSVTAWGYNGLGETTVPNSLTNVTVTAVAAGGYHSLALTSAGKVVGWGYDFDGQSTVPASLDGKTVTAIAAGNRFSMALTSDGKVVAWGDHYWGETTVPASLDDKTVTAIAAGYGFALALTSEGQIVAWGDNQYGQTTIPASLNGKTVTLISANGGYHSLALTSDGTVVAWGDNAYGELNVPSSLTGRVVTALSAGDFHSLVASAPDITPPDTVLDSGPSGTSASASATFTFHGDPTNDTAGYECSLDGGAYTSCASPKSFASLPDGSHTFAVRAKDAAGNTDQSPATRTWTVDTTPPDTVLDSGPSGAQTSASASFTFHGDPTNDTAGYECSLDAGAWSACDSGSRTYLALTDGTHTFAVRAKDAAGNADATPASRTWSVDTTAPETTIDAGPVGATSSTSAEFTFHGTPALETAGYECRLDTGAWAPCTSPATYTGLSETTHTFAVRAHDALDNTDPTPATRSFTVDVTAPDTSIISGPKPGTSTTATTATFDLSSHGDGNHFECSLDDGPWRTCRTSVTYIALTLGEHTFAVRAVDDAGNLDPTPDTTHWTITDGSTPADTTAPDTQITSGPTGTVGTNDATFDFTSSDGDVDHYECSLDGAAFTGCTAPLTYAGLVDGPHTFAVRAADSAGNTDPTPATGTWVIETAVDPEPDTTPPNTRFTNRLDGYRTHKRRATAKFAATEPGATFECSIDKHRWTTCSSPIVYRHLARGRHVLRVRATDPAGNIDKTPAKAVFTIRA